MTNVFAGTKSVPEQMQNIYEKWEPSSSTCVFQHYFYNQVPEERAPFYAPSPEDDGQKWEEALKKKPSPGSIPVLAKGPLAVGRRLEIQAAVVRAIQTRLHEINEILNKLLQMHDLKFSVRIQETRRRHVALGRRCLSLASKVQVLRNRGYNLDSAEEKLLMKLLELNKTAFDPMLSGRQEEIWARMSVLRERAQILKNETEGLAKEVKPTSENPLDEESMRKVEKVCSDFHNTVRMLTGIDFEQL
jgi:nuclear pore complex protein Nup54